jgi:Tfp pilus assembly protein PilX
VEACYCPFPQCGSGACICGGGKFIGCAPVALATCAAATARVAALCPELVGTRFDNFCTSTSDNSGCVTKCLNQVTACGDLVCSSALACDRATDLYTMCMGACKSALAAPAPRLDGAIP